jgi:2-oxoacid:acceptor oxidoreductase delta subunit (pyruvate/2-ketoisovalerate family)
MEPVAHRGRVARPAAGEAAPAPSSRYLPIAEHGLIGDLHTVALVGTDGTTAHGCERGMTRDRRQLSLHVRADRRCRAQGDAIRVLTPGRGRRRMAEVEGEILIARPVEPVFDSVCFSCDNCFGVCPDNAVRKTGDPAAPYAIDYDFCKGCGICVAECPAGAIDLVPETI